MKELYVHNRIKKEIDKLDEDLIEKVHGLFLLLTEGDSLPMPKSRPMPIVGAGVHELRIKDRTGQYRIFYYTKLKDKILVFHFFKKKTQATSKQEIDLSKQRLKIMKEGGNLQWTRFM